MKTSFTISLPKLHLPSLAAATGAALLFLSVGFAQGTASNQNQPWGFWVQTIPLGGGLNIQDLLHFHFDGAVTGTTSLFFGGAPPFAVDWRSPINGVWEKKGPKAITGVALGYNYDPTTGQLKSISRSRWTIEFSDDFNSYTGTASLDSVSCPSPLSCPDPSDPSVKWTPGFTGFTILGSRLKPIPVPNS